MMIRTSKFLTDMGDALNIPDKYTIQRVSFWLSVAILFAMPLETFHFFLGILHMLFEWSEASLDFLIEVIFDTSLHSTQVIVFYILMAVILYCLYQIWKKLPNFYRQQKINVLDFLSDEIDLIKNYWQDSWLNKLKLMIAGSGLIFLLFI